MAGSKDTGYNPAAYAWIIVLAVIILVIAGVLLAMRSKRAGKTGGFFGGKEKTDGLHLMLPAGRGPHTHEVDLDETGFGVSTRDRDHRHVIENTIDIGLEQNGDVAPADHRHSITTHIVDV